MPWTAGLFWYRIPVIVILTYGHVGVARNLAWHLDLLDVFPSFLIGLLQSVPMLLLGRVPNDAMWWFVCYLGLANVSFANLINVRMRTPRTIALPLVRRRTILTFAHSYLLVLAIVACYFDWHVKAVGVLFMVEHIGIVAGLYWLDLRTRRNSAQSNDLWDDGQSGKPLPSPAAGPVLHPWDHFHGPGNSPGSL